MRRVRDRAKLEGLFPVWRHHPFLTNSTEPAAQADITHRKHAIIETVLSDVIDGPLAHPRCRRGQNERPAQFRVCVYRVDRLLSPPKNAHYLRNSSALGD